MQSPPFVYRYKHLYGRERKKQKHNINRQYIERPEGEPLRPRRKRTDRQADKWTDRHRGDRHGQTDRQRDRQTDRQETGQNRNNGYENQLPFRQ